MKKTRLSSLVIMVMLLVAICGFTATAAVTLNPGSADFVITAKFNMQYAFSDQPVLKLSNYPKAAVKVYSASDHSGGCYANVYNADPDNPGYIGASAQYFNNAFTGTLYIPYTEAATKGEYFDVKLAIRSSSEQSVIITGYWTASSY